MNNRVSIVLVGIGGYGENYIRTLLSCENDRNYYISGIVDPTPGNCSLYPEILKRNIPVFSELEDFFKEAEADLTVISSPIQYHRTQSCLALRKGSNVLCEKPMCSTVNDAMDMLKARDESGKFLAIGYQWSYSKAIQALKMDVINGILGKPKKLKTIVLWPRDHLYFNRSWAGKKFDHEGNWILDSVANNATAHYLHNMFYILGDRIDSSKRPLHVTAELYRANKIENYDTAAARVVTDNCIEILFYTSHAVESQYGPVFNYEFEDAVVSYGHNGLENTITAFFRDGKVKNYGDPSAEDTVEKLFVCIDAVSGRKSIPCGPEAAISQTLCVNAMQVSMPDISTFPDSIIRIKKNQLPQGDISYVTGLSEILHRCYESSLLPNEIGVPWAKKGKKINVDELFFNSHNTYIKEIL